MKIQKPFCFGGVRGGQSFVFFNCCFVLVGFVLGNLLFSLIVVLFRLRQNKQLPAFTSADDNMASNERFIQISETDSDRY
jgi:hypothetical protein